MSPGYESATHSFYYGQDPTTCTYNTGVANTGTLTSPSIGGAGASATLRFWYWRQVEAYKFASYDKTYVQVTYNGGLTWTTVWSEDSKIASENAWTQASVVLSPTSSTMQVRFVFDSVDSFNNGYKGWLIDDVTVQNN